MKHIIFADSHIHPWTQFATGGAQNNSRVQTTLRVIEEIREFAICHGITSAIHLGDVFHSWTAQKYEYFNVTYDAFREFKLNGIDLTFLIGNHDLVTRDESGLTTIDSFVDIARIIKGGSPVQFNDKIWVFPYTRNFEQAVQKLQQVPNDTILLHHLDIVNADTGLGWVSEIGIGREHFAHFSLVLGGHYHKYQQLTNKCYYMGCCCPQLFNERDQCGYFVVLDDETAEVTWHQTSAPRFVRYKPDEGQFDEKAACDYFKNTYVQVVAETSVGLEQDLKRWGAVSLMFVPERRVTQVVLRDQNISLTANSNEVIKSYAIKHRGSLPQEELIATGLEIFQSTQ